MPRQIYRCEVHGEFEEWIPFGQPVPKELPCSNIGGLLGYNEIEVTPCDKRSPWVPSAPNFIGGPTTGAQKE